MRILLAAALIASGASFASALPPPPQKHQQIRGEGCVEPGAETRCMVVKDIRTGALFELLFKGVPPALDSGIEFSGVPHQGVTTCNQGTPLDVLNWVHKDLKCTEGTAPKPRK